MNCVPDVSRGVLKRRRAKRNGETVLGKLNSPGQLAGIPPETMKRAPDISTALAMLSSDVFVSNKVQRVLPGWNVNSSDAANNNLRLAPLLAENMHPNSNLHGAPMLKLSADDVKSNMARQMASQQQWPSSLNPNQQNGHASNRIVDDADANVHRAKIALMEDRFRRCMCTGKPVDAKDQQEYEELCAMMLQYSGHTQQEPSSWKKGLFLSCTPFINHPLILCSARRQDCGSSSGGCSPHPCRPSQQNSIPRSRSRSDHTEGI